MPDLSFHEESGSAPVSSRAQESGIASSSPPEAVILHDSAIEERLSQFNLLSPEHRLLLSLLRPEEQQYFSESVDPGSAQSLSALSGILTRERIRRKANGLLRAVLALTLGIGGVSLASAYWLDPHPGQTVFGFAVALPLLVFLGLNNPMRPLEKAAFEYLLHLGDRRSVGLLLEQRHGVLLSDQQRVDQALIRVLPEFDAEDASHLTSVQRNYFYGILGYIYHKYNMDLRLATIAAMVRIGDRRDLNALYFVASGMAATKEEQAVRTAAQRGLYDLSARLDFGKVESIPDYLKRILSPFGSQANSDPPNLYLTDADSLYALISLLPQLTSTNYRKIFPQQADRDRLYSLLSAATLGSYGFDRLKLYREIVSALERVGDTRAMQALRQVAFMEAPTDGAKQLRTAANKALQTLRKQLEKEKVSKTLLRASNAPDTQPDELLRAAAPAESVTAPDELLRPVIPQQEQGPVTPAALAKAMESLRRQSQADDGP